MPDPYLPALGDFDATLTQAEKNAIADALTQADPWGWKPEDLSVRAALKSAKKKMLDYHLERHKKRCCYCRTNLKAAGPFMTDREHVLPKGNPVFRAYSYSMWNLGAACKRCNMQFKRTGEAFIVNSAPAALLQTSANYLLLHPNFDHFESHIVRTDVNVGSVDIVHFGRTTGSAKADYTYELFQLADFEKDYYDEAQTGAPAFPVSETVAAVRELMKQYGQ